MTTGRTAGRFGMRTPARGSRRGGATGGDDRRWHPRTPARASGLADHVWSLTEWATFPAAQPP
jgi:hypothetical protein